MVVFKLTLFPPRADRPQPDNRAAGENPPHPEVCLPSDIHQHHCHCVTRYFKRIINPILVSRSALESWTTSTPMESSGTTLPGKKFTFIAKPLGVSLYYLQWMFLTDGVTLFFPATTRSPLFASQGTRIPLRRSWIGTSLFSVFEVHRSFIHSYLCSIKSVIEILIGPPGSPNLIDSLYAWLMHPSAEWHIDKVELRKFKLNLNLNLILKQASPHSFSNSLLLCGCCP